MDKLLKALERNQLKFEAEHSSENNVDFDCPAVEIFVLARCLFGSRLKHWLKQEAWRNIALRDLTRDIQHMTVQTKEWTMQVKKERTGFMNFKENIQVNRKAVQSANRAIESTWKRQLSIRTVKFVSKTLAATGKCESVAKSLEKQIELLKFRLHSVQKIYEWRAIDLRDVRLKAEKQCLDRLIKYDNHVGWLRGLRTALSIEKDILVMQYIDMQNVIDAQRVLYNRLKVERQLDATKIFLEKLDNFQRNRAAKVIQRLWRSYNARIYSRKKKSRKYVS